jgi:diguanylate cyclase (GGDEF)-like protein
MTLASHRPPSSNAASGGAVPDAVYEATRSLIRIRLSAEAVAIISRAVRALGAQVLSEGAPADGQVVEAYISPGYQVRACAPAESPALLQVQEYLPLLAEDARAVLSTASAVERLARQAGIDQLTGLPDHNSLSRLFSRLRVGDVIIAMAIDEARPHADGASLGQDAGPDAMLASFAQALRQSVRKTDYCGRMGGDSFIAVLRDERAAAAERLLARIRAAWERVRPAPSGFSAGVATVTAAGWRAALSAAESALRRARESGGNAWETANEADYGMSPPAPTPPEPAEAAGVEPQPPAGPEPALAEATAAKPAAPPRRHFFRPGWANTRPAPTEPRRGRQP